MAELRDIEVQKDRLRFRKNLSRLGEILSYEMSRSLDYREKNISTPLETMSINVMAEQPVLISIMRAALPFFEGIQNFFDEAGAGFIGAYRSKDFSESKVIEMGYFAVPDLTGKTIVLADPMLATGKSMVDTINQLKKYGTPKKINLLAIIAAPEGIKYIEENTNEQVELWCAAIDERLDDHSYIVPGLGDAGDLAYGPKS
jgi:uracil phosphoribosyltransferase